MKLKVSRHTYVTLGGKELINYVHSNYNWVKEQYCHLLESLIKAPLCPCKQHRSVQPEVILCSVLLDGNFPKEYVCQDCNTLSQYSSSNSYWNTVQSL